MAKLNANYEAVYILKPDLGEEGTAAMVAKFKSLVEEKATLTEIDEWGKRHLAYPIQDLNEELDRIFRITDGVMRSIIVCKDE